MSKLAGVKADRPYSHRKLEGVADEVRNALDFGSTEAIDPLTLFEDLHEISITNAGKTIPLLSGVTASDSSEGLTRYDARKNRIEVLASESTYQWLLKRHPRAAFTVAHELGHCLLHTNQLVKLAQMPTKEQAAFHRGLSNHKPYEDTEWQANAFAGALLMPAKGLAALEKRHGILTPTLVQETYKVSYEAASIRLQVFGQKKEELLLA